MVDKQRRVTSRLSNWMLAAVLIVGMTSASGVLNPTAGNAQSQFTVLRVFTGGVYRNGICSKHPCDGAHPHGALLRHDSQRGTKLRLYGTTVAGGLHDIGTIFEFGRSRSFDNSRVSFIDSGDLRRRRVGRYPYAGLVLGPQSRLYGSTSAGDSFAPGGNVFRVNTTVGGRLDKLRTSYRFRFVKHGEQPRGRLLYRGSALFGTTMLGGKGGAGTIFKLEDGPIMDRKVLHEFAGEDGAEPVAGLIVGLDGAFYGTTSKGGAFNLGTVFRLSPPDTEGGAWQHQVLFDFGGKNGAHPRASLILNVNGSLIGTTENGGEFGMGTVFRLRVPKPGQAEWRLRTLHSFDGIGGAKPVAELLADENGLLFGTSAKGGPSDHGTVFSLRPPKDDPGAWLHAILHAFSGGDGSEPRAGLTIDDEGALYGTTFYGGGSSNCENGCGVMFKIER
jgi:uncharacterized repeat protein (TIGR03803 family)